MVSIGQPRRVLAYCETGHYLPRAIGGFLTHGLPLYRLRYIVYDAAGNIITKGTYPFDGAPSLSPNGRLLTVPHGNSIDLYTLP